MDRSPDVNFTGRIVGGVVLTAVSLALILEVVLQVFAGSPFLPAVFIGVLIVIMIVFYWWLQGQFRLQYSDNRQR